MICNICGCPMVKKNSRFICIYCSNYNCEDGQVGESKEQIRQERKRREKDKWDYNKGGKT